MDSRIGAFSILCLVLTLFLAPAQAELKAGVSVADITPPIGGEMAGYSARGANVSKGVHDPLYVRTLVLRDADDAVAIVTVDLAGLPNDTIRTVKREVKNRTGIDQVMLLPSHTHSGPGPSKDFPSKEKPWLEEATQKIIDSVVDATALLTPVSYGAGQGEVREGHNRRKVNPDGSVTMFWRNESRAPTTPVDHGLGVVQFNTLGGDPLATVVNFTCHPVILGPKNLLFSADFPGAMRPLVEQAVGGTCLYVNGACGDINPFMDKSDPEQGAFDEVEKMGKALADETIRVVKAVKMHDPDVSDLTVRTEVIPVEPRWDITDPEFLEPIEKQYGKALAKAYLSRFELPMKGDLVTVALGDDLAIVGLPGQFFVQHSLDLKARSAVPNTFVFGLCNEQLGYFPTINAASEGGYGAGGQTIVAVGAGEMFVNRALVNLYYQTNRLKDFPEL